MNEKLDQILISSSTPNWHHKLRELRQALFDSAYFISGDERHTSLMEILNGVRTRGDQAVQEYTEKFDGVLLAPQQFKISNNDLEKAHKKIDPKLLASLR